MYRIAGKRVISSSRPSSLLPGLPNMWVIPSACSCSSSLRCPVAIVMRYPSFSKVKARGWYRPAAGYQPHQRKAGLPSSNSMILWEGQGAPTHAQSISGQVHLGAAGGPDATQDAKGGVLMACG